MSENNEIEHAFKNAVIEENKRLVEENKRLSKELATTKRDLTIVVSVAVCFCICEILIALKYWF